MFFEILLIRLEVIPSKCDDFLGFHIVKYRTDSTSLSNTGNKTIECLIFVSVLIGKFLI